MKPVELPNDQVSLLMLSTPCQTFLKEVADVIKDFEEKHPPSENDKRAIIKIRALLLPQDEKTIPKTNGKTARLVLKEILREYYSYLGWRYWSLLAQLLDAVRRKPEYSETALGNGDYQALLPNFEHTQALTQENIELKKENRRLTEENSELKKENRRLTEENSSLKIRGQAMDKALVKAWEEKDTSDREKQELAQKHIYALRLAHGRKQAYDALKEHFEHELPGLKVAPLPESLSQIESDSMLTGFSEPGSRCMSPTPSFSFNRPSSTYHPELFPPQPHLPTTSLISPTSSSTEATLVPLKSKEERDGESLTF